MRLIRGGFGRLARTVAGVERRQRWVLEAVSRGPLLARDEGLRLGGGREWRAYKYLSVREVAGHCGLQIVGLQLGHADRCPSPICQSLQAPPIVFM